MTPPRGMSALKDIETLADVLIKVAHPNYMAPWAVRDRVQTILWTVFAERMAAVRADERVKAWNEAIEKAAHRAYITAYSNIEFGKRMELEHEVMKLNLLEAQPVEPTVGKP